MQVQLSSLEVAGMALSLASISSWWWLDKLRFPSKRKNLFSLGLATLGFACLMGVLLPGAFKLGGTVCVIGFFPFFLIDTWTRVRYMKRRISDLDALAAKARAEGDLEAAQLVEEDAERWREKYRKWTE